jgi:hypothetical protein
MKNFTFLLCLFLTGLYSCTPNPDNSESEETMTKMEATVSEKEKAINQVVKDAYAFITFEKGTTPDYEALRALFTTDATLYNFRGDGLEFSFIDDFIAGFKVGIDSGEMIAFKEVELGGKTEYFGNIGHRISAYASYFDGAEEIGEKGVNSFQVLKVNGKWLINSIIWDVEKNGQSIPERYLTEK